MSEKKCEAKTEVWARVCGFFRPVAQWNRGKQAEYAERKPYDVSHAKTQRCEGAD